MQSVAHRLLTYYMTKVTSRGSENPVHLGMQQLFACLKEQKVLLSLDYDQLRHVRMMCI